MQVLAVSQVAPSYSGVHVQVKLVPASTQVAPFLHGEEIQAESFILQNSPENPVLHTQVALNPSVDSTHVP
jgi:hypothetical protein